MLALWSDVRYWQIAPVEVISQRTWLPVFYKHSAGVISSRVQAPGRQGAGLEMLTGGLCKPGQNIPVLCILSNHRLCLSSILWWWWGVGSLSSEVQTCRPCSVPPPPFLNLMRWFPTFLLRTPDASYDLQWFSTPLPLPLPNIHIFRLVPQAHGWDQGLQVEAFRNKTSLSRIFWLLFPLPSASCKRFPAFNVFFKILISN